MTENRGPATVVTISINPDELRPGDVVVAVGDPECYECGAPWRITVNRAAEKEERR